MSDFRFREDTGWERRCPECADWWPITVEYWDKRWHTRCKACIRAWKRANQNRRYALETDYRQTRKDAAKLTAWKDRQNRPEVIRSRKTAYYWANRERILERMRIAHHAKKRAA